jgi:hypothetical protein
MTQAKRAESRSPFLWVTIGIGYAVAGAVFFFRIFLGDLPLSMEIAGAVTLAAVAATPATLAVLGLNGRPGLLLPAGICALISAPVLSVLWVFEAPLGVACLIAYGRTRERGSIVGTLAATAIVTVLWVGAASVMFLHLDPRCAETLQDGTVHQVDAESRGFEPGWVWDAGSEIIGSSITPGNVVEEVCSSDVVTLEEALVGLLLLAAAFAVGWVLVEPVPSHEGLTA